MCVCKGIPIHLQRQQHVTTLSGQCDGFFNDIVNR